MFRVSGTFGVVDRFIYEIDGEEQDSLLKYPQALNRLQERSNSDQFVQGVFDTLLEIGVKAENIPWLISYISASLQNGDRFAENLFGKANQIDHFINVLDNLGKSQSATPRSSLKFEQLN